MKKVIIIGAGGHSAEIDEYIAWTNKLESLESIAVTGFIDDNPSNYTNYKFSASYLGSIKDHIVSPDIFYLIGIANLEYRRPIVEKIRSQGGKFMTFIHPTAYISDSASIDEGSIIGPNANIGPNVSIGKYTLVNSRCSFGHDTIVGDYNFISPNVCFSGFTKVGDDNLFGINSATIPGIKVGNANKIAAGMVLDKNVGNESVVFHRFKEKIIAIRNK